MGSGLEPLDNETIVAIATPPGRGGMGIVRVSGARARAIVEPMLQLRQPMEAGRARFGYLLDGSAGLVGGSAGVADGERAVLDEVVVTYFAGPRSYTGEDVVEIAAHGSPVVMEAVLRGCLAMGARLAEPGEFTERAFLSGRLDLTQAEAVNDLIRATTMHQARSAASQMGGAVSRELLPTKDLLVGLIATMEAGVDFAEDDIDVLPGSEIVERILGVTAPLERMERSYAYGRLVREGFRLAIVGRPNAGKSSIFNALVERERAIVTAAPGTTRDLVTETISIGGLPVELIDTAGLRADETGEGRLEEAEVMGIRRSREALADADVVLLVVDGTAGLQAEDLAILNGEEWGRDGAVGGGRRLVVALNKSDLFGAGPAIGAGGVTEALRVLTEAAVSGRLELVQSSTRDGSGLPELRSALVGVMRRGGAAGEGGMLTNLRQHRAVTEALRALGEARGAAIAGLPHEVLLMDLHRGLEALDELTGTTTTEDILRRIFSGFCIGK